MKQQLPRASLPTGCTAVSCWSRQALWWCQVGDGQRAGNVPVLVQLDSAEARNSESCLSLSAAAAAAEDHYYPAASVWLNLWFTHLSCLFHQGCFLCAYEACQYVCTGPPVLPQRVKGEVHYLHVHPHRAGLVYR
jgi:hypothetical protein